MSATKTVSRLRRLAEDWRYEEVQLCKQFGDVIAPQSMRARRIKDTKAIDAAVEMIDRLEAAESDALEQARLNGMGASREAALMAKLEAAEKEAAHIKEVEFPRKVRAVVAGWETKCARIEQERDALRARIEAMERQEPVARTVGCVTEWVSNGDGTYSLGGCLEAFAPLPDDAQLYAHPGAQPAPSALAEAIIADMQAQHDSELITENDSGEALIRLDGAIAAVEDNFALAQPAPSVPKKIKRVESGFKGMFLREAQAYKQGWNECRAAMIAAAPEAKP